MLTRACVLCEWLWQALGFWTLVRVVRLGGESHCCSPRFSQAASRRVGSTPSRAQPTPTVASSTIEGTKKEVYVFRVVKGRSLLEEVPCECQVRSAVVLAMASMAYGHPTCAGTRESAESPCYRLRPAEGFRWRARWRSSLLLGYLSLVARLCPIDTILGCGLKCGWDPSGTLHSSETIICTRQRHLTERLKESK